MLIEICMLKFNTAVDDTTRIYNERQSKEFVVPKVVCNILHLSFSIAVKTS